MPYIFIIKKIHLKPLQYFRNRNFETGNGIILLNFEDDFQISPFCRICFTRYLFTVWLYLQKQISIRSFFARLVAYTSDYKLICMLCEKFVSKVQS
jgi:hypothetical protein